MAADGVRRRKHETAQLERIENTVNVLNDKLSHVVHKKLLVKLFIFIGECCRSQEISLSYFLFKEIREV